MPKATIIELGSNDLKKSVFWATPIGVPSQTTMAMYVLITMTHHFSNILLVELWEEPCFCPICKILPVWFNYTMFRRLSCFRLTTVFENCHSDTLTHYIKFQDINLQLYFKMACVKSILWPVLVSNIVDVSLSSGSLGYWTACNNVKRHCTLPYGGCYAGGNRTICIDYSRSDLISYSFVDEI